MTGRIILLIALFCVGVIAAIVGCFSLIVGGYEADLNPGSLGVNWLGWRLLGGGLIVIFGAGAGILIPFASDSRRRNDHNIA
ncbi:hypothetical protein [Rathayibacter toxicus]|uniref:hypothetical protein n=1 Tax=Rathayibacter toxicus TaxID=145458 RepID=UPI001C05DC6C|nr:hypothetical protein [Rathayibacter toxicus]QWL30907.1 hypothetical protein E2R34_09245 [Rathayibacter toxicus]